MTTFKFFKPISQRHYFKKSQETNSYAAKNCNKYGNNFNFV